MKIPFDIKFRQQIESGEYKVVTCCDDRPVRIISWDKKVCGGGYEIVALVPTSQDDMETVQLYCPDGTHIANNWSEKYNLFIVTPEPELTEFEKKLKWLFDEWKEHPSEDAERIRVDAKELLDLAKKELCKGCNANLEGYIKGRQDAQKEMGENTVYKHEGPTPPAYWPPCLYGGECSNPFHDCINCHRQSTGGTTGTSTAKLEG